MSNLNLNKVVLAGRITADPELKLTPSNISVISGSIAINRPVRVVNNERVAEVDYINFVAWRKTAEFIAKYFKKGSAICVTGSIQTRSWDGNDGQKRYATEVVVDEAMFVDSLSSTVPSLKDSAASMQELGDNEELPFE